MHQQKLVGRHALIVVRFVREPAQMPPPFGADHILEITGEMPFRPQMPGSNNQKKHGHVLPPQKPTIPEPCFAIEHRQQYKNRRRIKEAEQTLGQTRESGANPKPGEQVTPMAPALITAQCAEDRASDERADERFGHDDAREQKCAAEAKINQTGNETAPVIRELFPNQKNKSNRGDHRERDREASSSFVYTEELERNDNEPVEQRRLLEARDTVIRWQKPLMRLDHLTGGSRILPFCLTV